MTRFPLPCMLRFGAALVLSASLSACGGGGSESEPELASSHTSSSDWEAGSPQAPSQPDPATSGEQSAALSTGNTCALPNFQAEALQRINAYRARGATCGANGSFAPTTALQWSGPLQNAAARHSTDMAAKNFFSHTGSDGSNAGTRITQAGYAWGAWGENIAAGQSSVQAVVDGWMASPGHCANIMKPAFRDLGLACVKGDTTASNSRTHWTLNLAKPR